MHACSVQTLALAMSCAETNGLSGTLLIRGKLGRHRPHSCWIDAGALHWRQLTKAPEQHSLSLRDIISITPNSESYTFRVRALCPKDFGFVHRTFIFAVPKLPASLGSRQQGGSTGRVDVRPGGRTQRCAGRRLAAQPTR